MEEKTSTRLENLIGVLALTLSDMLIDVAELTAGFGGAGVAALVILAQEPGIGIDQLKTPLGRTQSATVRIVDRLSSEGYAARRQGRDGRTVAVHLTPSGEVVARKILGERRAVIRRVIEPLDNAERAIFLPLVEKILAGMTTSFEHGERMCRLCDLEACPRVICPVDIVARSDAPDPA